MGQCQPWNISITKRLAHLGCRVVEDLLKFLLSLVVFVVALNLLKVIFLVLLAQLSCSCVKFGLHEAEWLLHLIEMVL